MEKLMSFLKSLFYFFIGFLITLYLVSMFVIPWIQGEWNWAYVQNVWSRWQPLNAAMLALIASFIAIEVTRYQFNQQREQNFAAAKALLPKALSDLKQHLGTLLPQIHKLWQTAKDKNNYVYNLDDSWPKAPSDIISTFQECIRYGLTQERLPLSARLYELYQLHAQISIYTEVANPKAEAQILPKNVTDILLLLLQLHAKARNLEEYARNTVPLNEAEPTADDLEFSAWQLLTLAPEYKRLFDDTIDWTDPLEG